MKEAHVQKASTDKRACAEDAHAFGPRIEALGGSTFGVKLLNDVATDY